MACEDCWIPSSVLTEGPVVPMRCMTTFYKILEVHLDNKYNVLFKFFFP